MLNKDKKVWTINWRVSMGEREQLISCFSPCRNGTDERTHYHTPHRRHFCRYSENVDVFSAWLNKLLSTALDMMSLSVCNTYGVHCSSKLIDIGRTRAQIKQHTSRGPHIVRWKTKKRTRQHEERWAAMRSGRGGERESCAHSNGGYNFPIDMRDETKIICQICKHDLSLNHDTPGTPRMLLVFFVDSTLELSNAFDIGPRAPTMKMVSAWKKWTRFPSLGDHFPIQKPAMYERAYQGEEWNESDCVVMCSWWRQQQKLIQ